jgi:hypothetical protein
MTSMGASLGGMARSVEIVLARRARGVLLACTRPFGYLAFVLALMALSTTAKLLGEQQELGYFAGRLSQTIRRYPEVTRRGVQMAWLSWFLLLALALSPIDPLATRWDEVLLVAFALAALWRRAFAAQRAGR